MEQLSNKIIMNFEKRTQRGEFRCHYSLHAN